MRGRVKRAGFLRKAYLCYMFLRAVSTDETSYEAGIKVQIHSQDEPPFIDQLGFGVAPGFQTFVSCQQQLVPNVQPQPPLFIYFFAPLLPWFVPKSCPSCCPLTTSVFQSLEQNQICGSSPPHWEIGCWIHTQHFLVDETEKFLTKRNIDRAEPSNDWRRA